MSTRTYERRDGRHRPRYQPEPSQFDDFATGLADAVERLVRAFDPAERPGRGDMFGVDTESARRGRRRGRRCDGCGRSECGGSCHRDRCPPRCQPCDCHCACCIGDVDIVVYARAGETRIIPVRLENHRKRERDIALRLADFRTRGGAPTGVVGQLAGPASFTLDPCSEREVVIKIGVGLHKLDLELSASAHADLTAMTKAELLDEARRTGAETTSTMNKNELINAISDFSPIRESVDLTGHRPIGTIDERTMPDVDDCHVAVADLCIEGCDSRPIRIAVAVLPRDCNSYTVRCECACC